MVDMGGPNVFDPYYKAMQLASQQNAALSDAFGNIATVALSTAETVSDLESEAVRRKKSELELKQAEEADAIRIPVVQNDGTTIHLSPNQVDVAVRGLEQAAKLEDLRTARLTDGADQIATSSAGAETPLRPAALGKTQTVHMERAFKEAGVPLAVTEEADLTDRKPPGQAPGEKTPRSAAQQHINDLGHIYFGPGDLSESDKKGLDREVRRNRPVGGFWPGSF